VGVHPLHVINADSVSTIRLNQQISTLRPVGYCHPHPHRHLWLLVGAKADIHFTIPQRVEAASAVFFSGGSHKQNCPWRASFQGFLLSQFDVLAQDHGDTQREKWALHIGRTCVFTVIHQSVGCTYFVLCQEHTVLLYIMSLCTCLVSKLVSWCLTSLSSTNMAISETISLPSMRLHSPAAKTSPHFGRYSYHFPLTAGGWVGLDAHTSSMASFQVSLGWPVAHWSSVKLLMQHLFVFLA